MVGFHDEFPKKNIDKLCFNMIYIYITNNNGASSWEYHGMLCYVDITEYHYILWGNLSPLVPNYIGSCSLVPNCQTILGKVRKYHILFGVVPYYNVSTRVIVEI